jgi:tetratricopeptide (TPR) repeat protein
LSLPKDQGYFDDGLNQFEEELKLARELGDQSSVARIQGDIDGVLILKGDLLGAKRRFEEQLAIGLRISDEKQSAYAHDGLGRILMMQGEITEAIKEHAKALKLRLKLNEQGLAAETRLAFAETELEGNKLGAAATDAKRAADQFRIEKENDQESLAWALLARSLAAQTLKAQASKAASNARELLPRVHNIAFRLSIITTLARVEAVEGNIERAQVELRNIANRRSDGPVLDGNRRQPEIIQLAQNGPFSVQ